MRETAEAALGSCEILTMTRQARGSCGREARGVQVSELSSRDWTLPREP